MDQLYDRIGTSYARGRRTDPRWMSVITESLGDAESLVNVGAGTGSYEPADRDVIAVEPSAAMIRQRPEGSPPVVRAVAERLPVRSGVVDAALAVLTVHHWADWRRGLAELRRVAPLRVVLAYDVRRHLDYWFVREYVPEIADLERRRPSAPEIAAELGAERMIPLPLPWDFTDGVFPAHWRRPEAYLDPEVRRNCSALARCDPAAAERGLRRLRADLAGGRWRRRHQDLLDQREYDAGFRLVVSRD
ncbi:Methyltransferase domain-containing protein [Amycolatopsis arida]|uniref:Methyltransferase domain-containing protein n=1 Tax=Amycolatopsis arida TaxID=587909 RepID=A0A1I5SG05_9PSEU|nr:class I SAM-dependent methyltransferase [Amycolatopsis arida]TDX96487.1 methyltransferase family protein [Amycolatopsis arida]SFP69635.1 Methyltransferase domain-containing protein [Amycolatopsis arida]